MTNRGMAGKRYYENTKLFGDVLEEALRRSELNEIEFAREGWYLGQDVSIAGKGGRGVIVGWTKAKAKVFIYKNIGTSQKPFETLVFFRNLKPFSF